MKKYKKKILIVLIIFFAVLINSKSSYAYTANPTTEGGKKVCATAESLLTYMHDHPQWRYNSHMPAGYKKNWITAKPHKQSTCGTFVKWVFQLSGYLKEDTTISHKSTSAATKSAYEKNTVDCTWYTPNKKISRVRDQLLPGDCITLQNSKYDTIAIYAGYENGTYYTYNCIGKGHLQRCIDAKGAGLSKISSYNVLCVVRPGEGGTTPNFGSDSSEYGSSSVGDNETQTFAGALANIARNLLDSMITLFENYTFERNDSTVMYDLNPDDDGAFYGDGGTADGSLVNAPDSKSVKKFASTKLKSGRFVPIQHFAITDLDTRPIVWLGCNPGSDPRNFSVKIFRNATTKSLGNRDAKITLKAGGHQDFVVWKNGNKYNVYTGSFGNALTKRQWGRRYYNPRGVNKTVVTSTTTSWRDDLGNKGIKITSGQQNINALGVDENAKKMVTLVSGRATVWDLDVVNFNNSKKTGQSFRIRNGLYQGGCLSGNYFYLIGGWRANKMLMGCYDITTGKEVWCKNINTASITRNYEPEGIQVYNYNGTNKIFIAFNKGGGIWYFDN